MELQFLFAFFLIIPGIFFLLIGSVGLIRLPDFFTRSHATGKADTLGIILVIAGLIITQRDPVNIAKLLVIVIFVALTNPTATNALTRAAVNFRAVPWFKKDHETGARRDAGIEIDDEADEETDEQPAPEKTTGEPTKERRTAKKTDGSRTRTKKKQSEK